MLTGSLEENVLTLLCWHDESAVKLAGKIKPAHFLTVAWRKISEVAIAHVLKYNVAPKEHLRDLMEKQLRHENDKLIELGLDNMDRLHQSIQVKFVMDKLDEFLELREVGRVVARTSEALQKEDLKKAYESLSSLTVPIKEKPGIWLNDPDQVMGSLSEEQEVEFFPTGIPALDKMGVTPLRESLMIFLAETNKGKSWWAVTVGAECIMNGKSVLHVTLEMKDTRVLRRYVQNMFALTKGEAETVSVLKLGRDSSGEYDDQRSELESMFRRGIADASRDDLLRKLRQLKFRPPLLIKEYPPGVLTVQELESLLNALRREKGFVPDAIIVDYPDKMSVSKTNLRIDIGQTVIGLRAIASKYKCLVYAPSQTSRQSVGAQWVNRKHTAEDFSKIQTADTVITYSQTRKEEEIGKARILVDKARDTGKPKGAVLITQSYAMGQFCIDSIRMNQKARDELKREAA